MQDGPVFTADQVAEASTALRTALGHPPEHFPLGQFLSMIGDEIRELRSKGWDDAEIAALISESTGTPIGPEAIGLSGPDDR